MNILYKFKDEYTIEKYKGGFVILNNRVYTNPKEEILREAGYKPLANVSEPEYDQETQCISVEYREDEDVITPIYTVYNNEFDVIESELNDVIDSEINEVMDNA